MSAEGSRRPASIYRGNLLALGLVSLFTDVSSEMIVPLLPLFLATTLAAPAFALGLIEGVADATAAVFKAASGWASDRGRRRKPLVLFGYSISTAARPLIGLAGSWGAVLACRFADRVGKGIRSAPRDALLAGSVPAERRGEAFGFHRAMDHTGAVIGPLVAAALLGMAGLEVRSVFLLAAIPGAVAVAVIAFGVRDEEPAPRPVDVSPTPIPPLSSLPANYWQALGLFTLLSLSLASDTFLLLRASALGLPGAALPLLWAGFHVVKALANQVGGRLSDRLGRKALLGTGWTIYAASYFGFAEAARIGPFLAVLALYALHFGCVEGVEKAAIADLVPAPLRGRAFGLFHAATGLALLPASALFGWAWTAASPEAAFRLAGALALVGPLALPFLRLSAPASPGSGPPRV